jgi:ElaB/YqjD/DUF883 family membrane-anchored ribosome-binding protein
MIFTNSASSQSSVVPIDPISIEDLKEIDRAFQERAILKNLVAEQTKTIAELEKSLAIAQKERDLEKRENELNLRIIAIKDQEIAGLNRNFDQMKEVADRAIKLAETSRPSSNWQLIGLAAAVVFVAGLVVGGL